ncbi:MAG: UDP-N-acetylglucosamine 1-carboxyvinyltransferase [Prochlorotrichaceae cyanobacterium]
MTALSNSSDHAPTSSALEIWGQQPLQGEVSISGAKNSALVIMAGALLSSEECLIHNVPNLADVNRMVEILRSLGVGVDYEGHSLHVQSRSFDQTAAPYELVSQLRASFFCVGPMLARLGMAQIPLPGGCAIGARPVDLHVRGLQAMGAHVYIDHGVVHASVAGSQRRLKGAKIYLDFPSVGATETLMMAATLADGETTIENAAQEPEVSDLADFCRAMGAQIRGDGTKTIYISGVPKLHAVEWNIIPDRVEAGTFLVAGAITQSEISLNPVIPDHLIAAIAKLEAIGHRVVSDGPKTLRLVPTSRPKSVDIETLPYPGFPTDMQAQFMALLTLSEGNSLVTETVFENRLRHVAELKRMGADIRLKGNNALITGVPKLSGAPVMATDLRASAALVLAGLAAEGCTIVTGLQHLDRGYEHLDQKLLKLGARIRRITMEDTSPTLVPVEVG